ncbi:hypothetical protein JCM9534A_28920 [Catenuloplanes indicus JCM 9534]
MDIGAELFAISAACVRARAEAAAHPEVIELADLFSRQARLRADALFDALRANTDSVDNAAARRLLAGRYAFLERGIVPPGGPGEWVAPWEPGAATVPDVRRRLPTSDPAT